MKNIRSLDKEKLASCFNKLHHYLPMMSKLCLLNIWILFSYNVKLLLGVLFVWGFLLFTNYFLLCILKVSILYQATNDIPTRRIMWDSFVVNYVLLNNLYIFYFKIQTEFKKSNRKQRNKNPNPFLFPWKHRHKLRHSHDLTYWRTWGSLTSAVGTSWCFLLGELAAFKGNEKENGITLGQGRKLTLCLPWLEKFKPKLKQQNRDISATCKIIPSS